MQMRLLFLVSTAALFGGPCPANARMLRFPALIQHDPKEPGLITHHVERQTVGYPSLETSAVNVVLYGVLGCVGLSLSVLLLFCLYDAAKQWRHRSHFHKCKKKVQRVHDVLEKNSGDLPLCPCCAEFVSSKPSRSAVVFLCGHRFHIECANRLMREQEITESSTSCPLCVSCSIAGPDSTVEDVAELASDEDGTVLGQPDEAKSFILRSLSKEFPDIIREDCVKRWCQCHTELWLSELSCPGYTSIFQSKETSYRLGLSF